VERVERGEGREDKGGASQCPFSSTISRHLSPTHAHPHPHPPTGVANLDKRARAAAETRHLTSLGFPAPKRPRIPASIGLGMAAKQKELASAALEAAIDAGLVSRSGLGKKKRRVAEAARRAAGAAGGGGLDSPGGALRNGVLFVREAPLKKGGKGGGRRFNIDKIKL